ncbi:MAG TPA: glycosyltransferase family 4 protein, partial [Phycisphaerae bacterium]|nr:glycosyltransferase family 4 protein [Phycisphaerae bacterium]
MRGRVAYCEVPKLAGVYTFAVNLAAQLPRFGYDLRLVGVGPQAKADYASGLSMLPAEILAPEAREFEPQREALVGWLRRESIDIVMISGSEAEHRLVPALPASIRVVSVVNNATRGHYRVATYGHERMHRLVCVSPRLRRDIIRRFGVPAEKTVLIPYGIDAGAYRRDASSGEPGNGASPLRLVYLGRMCDSAKGIFLIPRILARLDRAGVPFHLTVIGDGPDRERFASRMTAAGLASRWTHKGTLRYDAVADELRHHDVMLMPSRHEGFGMVLVEAMAAGCVPVLSRIKGVTDSIVTSADHGILCPMGRVSAFASAIASLARDRGRLRHMSAAASARVCEAFTREEMA